MQAGREGGMWLGVSVKEKVRSAALLNVTGEERKDGAKGRGFLVADYLKGRKNFEEYLSEVRENGPHNAFNMVAVELGLDGVKIFHHSNLLEELFEYEGKQTVGFGNSNPNVPFTKVERGLERFRGVVKGNNDKEKLIEKLVRLLKWEERHLPDPELQRRAPQAYEHLSSVFVKIPEAGYGTR